MDKFIITAALGLYVFGTVSPRSLRAALLVQTGYLVYRGVLLGRLPLVGVHDTLSFLAASTAAFSLALHYTMQREEGITAHARVFTGAVSGLAAFYTAIALLQPPHAMPLPPVLKTYWFELHVALSFFSYGLFGLAAVLGGIYLKWGEPRVERLQYKAAFIGYGFFSLSMVFGGIWAYYAWGTYWLWTPKELWTSLLWVYYSLYLHMRLRPNLAGRPSALAGIVGYALVLFTYLGVSLLMKSSHSF